MFQLTLLRRNHELARTARQREILETASEQPPFVRTLAGHGFGPLRADGIQVLQVNVGKLCNQTCHHCHVDAGPDRREIMSRETANACLAALAASDIPVLDITGGAPELTPNFRRLVTEARRLGRYVIDRCNLTILLAPGYEDLPEFLAEQQVEIVASLPCYLEQNTDAQRGAGVFRKSIAALKRLNDVGYGRPGSGLTLTLVFNPVGRELPPSQPKLEAAYRRELRTRYGVEFTRLHTITNMPISRFLEDLLQRGEYETYMQKLVEAFNPAAVAGVMCRTMISVDWRGRLYDCDFNQMLDLDLAPGLPRNIREFDPARLGTRPIVTGQHCYGCTAGAGSSCQGAIAT
ncbi:MAG: arsenosugar biosynthesis radical SAM protein ArsS [Planctomycetes bacterium]|nr:arsenosugar biosynthesis radical SAM protein ArsS [Planctomycetota bacterium]